MISDLIPECFPFVLFELNSNLVTNRYFFHRSPQPTVDADRSIIEVCISKFVKIPSQAHVQMAEDFTVNLPHTKIKFP